jgi:hypothetical protein
MYYRARFYHPALGRFVSADTIVPEPRNPQDFNRYSYVRNSPIVYTDPTGHCIFGVDTLVCLVAAGAVIGAAVGYGAQVYDNVQDGMTFGEALTTDIEPGPIVAGAMIGAFIPAAASFVATVVGVGGTAAAGSAGTVATAACADGDCTNEARAIGDALCADGDCTNEISTLTTSDLPAIERFSRQAIEINASRNMDSFGHTWNLQSQSLLEIGEPSRMFIARTGGQITGMMQVQYTTNGYKIFMLEGVGQGGGTALFLHAIQDSIARGYGGSVYGFPTEQAMGFYSQYFPGYQILPDGTWYWSAEAAQAILGGQ